MEIKFNTQHIRAQMVRLVSTFDTLIGRKKFNGTIMYYFLTTISKHLQGASMSTITQLITLPFKV
jgi:hypothetical protein